MTKHYRTALISSTILLLFLLFTRPDNVPAAFLMMPFLLIFAVLLFGSLSVLSAIGAPKQVVLRVALVMAGLPVGLLVLQSLGQLTLRDCAVIIVLFLVAYFYLSRFGARSAAR